MRSIPRRLSALVLLVVAFLAGACSSGSDAPTGDGDAKAAGSFPVEITTEAGSVTIAAMPTHIISLSPTATEMIFAIGAGPQVVAVDDQSNFPEDAPTSELSGFTPNVEAIVGMAPDLVIVQYTPDDLAAGLEAAGVPVLVLPAAMTLEDTYAQLGTLGRATGHTDGATEVIAGMKKQIAAIVAATKKPAKPLTYYHELDDTLYSVTSKTFIGDVYGLFGLVNIADDADKDGSGYPQLSQEFLVSADPDLIFLADTRCCGQSADSVALRPGWGALTAVKNGSVVELDDDIASRWGPRVVDLVQSIADAVTAASK